MFLFVEVPKEVLNKYQYCITDLLTYCSAKFSAWLTSTRLWLYITVMTWWSWADPLVNHCLAPPRCKRCVDLAKGCYVVIELGVPDQLPTTVLLSGVRERYMLEQACQGRPWIPCNLVIPSRFILWKNSFSEISRKCMLPNMIRKG